MELCTKAPSRLKLAPLRKLMRKRLPSDAFVTHAHHDDAAARTLVLADQLKLIEAANFLMRASTHTESYRVSRRPHCLGAAARDDAPTPGAKKRSRRGDVR